jgi:KIF-binding protein
LLEFSCQRIDHKDFSAEDDKLVGKQAVLFREFEQPFPHVALPTDIEGCKSLFRQANTQFKKALEVFVLDGYVTEHIEVLFSQSRLYKSLGLLEKSGERKASMLEKRREMLEPLMKELNPKAYPATWQKILVEVSEIINDLFSLRVTLLGAKGFPSEEKLAQSLELGKLSIHYYH